MKRFKEKSIFITKYLNFLNKNNNPNIFYIVKSSFFLNIFLRFFDAVNFPFQLKKLKVDKLYSPMILSNIFSFTIKFILALHSNLLGTFSKMPGNNLKLFYKIFMKFH